MASRPSTRIAETLVSVFSNGRGNSTTRRVNLTTTASTVTLPAKISRAIFKNAGSVDVRIRINASGANFWTLKPNEQTPIILVNGSVVDAASASGTSILECIFEG